MERKSIREKVSLAIMIITVLAVIGLTTFISKSLFESITTDNNSYILRGIVDTVRPVVNEVEKVIHEPFNDSTVETIISFYDKKGSKEDQEKSLIMYDRTYMPSTGILYGSDNTFDVLAIYEGEVSNIETNDVFGTIITITHNNNLISKYSSLASADVAIGDTVNQGEIIGTSGINKVSSSKKNMLLFEISANGEYVNPTLYFNNTIESMTKN